MHEQGRPRLRDLGFDFSPAKSPESQQKNLEIECGKAANNLRTRDCRWRFALNSQKKMSFLFGRCFFVQIRSQRDNIDFSPPIFPNVVANRCYYKVGPYQL